MRQRGGDANEREEPIASTTRAERKRVTRAPSRIRCVPVDRATFRELAAAFPSGVTIVTTSDARGTPGGLTWAPPVR
ncbi:MAG TPA: hypothetical protein DCK98_03620 [Chloroflexi bacterium]|jgi:flavin reductase (DIM6/NTAB) family NADH-FMN oxidoreductase RutF|nr:hypothetical protein [Chloroflexota bacterium]HAL27318.1 hypothetical protein [Chloroflexota bacterium]